MELLFLGTGAGKPSGSRNVSALVLNLASEAGEYWLFDCGEATQHQMMRTSITPHRISKVFITHLHGDHIFGLPGLLTSRSMSANASPLDVYGPVGIKEFVESVLRLTQSYMTYELRVHEFEPGVVFQNQQFKVKALELKHRIPSFGFRVEEADRAGKLDVEGLELEGVRAGAIMQRLKNGEQVQLEDGRVIDGADYVGAPILGRVVAILGDTMPCADACELAYQADVLVHEATLESALIEQASLRGHSTTRQAAQVAKEGQAKQLIITHISQRYTPADEAFLLQECCEIFPATRVAHDLEKFTIV
ncbi:MAG: ribonuclease Z [Saezia sp.]